MLQVLPEEEEQESADAPDQMDKKMDTGIM